MSDDFNWFRDSSVIVGTQLAVAVYRNERGEIVIRQERDAYTDEDTFIVIIPSNVGLIIDALIDVVEQTETCSAVPMKDRTAAERQRRYRERRNALRNGCGSVTHNGSNGQLLLEASVVTS